MNIPAVIILGVGNYPDSCIDGNRAFEFDAQRNKLVIYASPSRSIAKNDGEVNTTQHFSLEEVSRHNGKIRKTVWLVIKSSVYDVSDYLDKVIYT
ncbi:unnamed protein product [Acanthoscelides obtectus]|uniref:Cytochrome b5 heme-binding domain-containing protein n=1 Tax=Acanthoscelides obtectus TaxID=200917 RepID=A0A9P0Q1F3_ACAOB|nr:unnamed protein product [Acanthoscelides obtectus]CAK1622580.1 hypothetical protein AOBTE_LOCUS1570 [Acanthoscelides obtectus]